MKNEYKKLKEYHNDTGRKRRKEWKFYEKMDEILGTKPATQLDVIIDKLADDSSHHDPEVIDEDLLEVGDDETSDVDRVNENEETKEGSEEKKAVENTKEVEKPEIKAKTTAAMKRKANHESRIDKSLATLVNAVTKAQKESDQMFIAFEEKRMKLDKKLLMIEDRRLRDEKERERLGHCQCACRSACIVSAILL